MSISYTAWPTAANVYARLSAANISPTMLVSDEQVAHLVSAVAAAFQRRTRRQFIADGSDVVRYYDGAGTGEQIVDAMTSLTSVEVLGYVGLGPLTLSGAYLADATGYPRDRILIAQGPPVWAPGMYYLDRFPEGRRNIKVTGRFGYAATIPVDVWEAILCGVAADIADANRVQSGGAPVAWHEGDTDERYLDQQIGEIAGWRAKYERAVSDYSVPTMDHIRRRHTRLW